MATLNLQTRLTTTVELDGLHPDEYPVFINGLAALLKSIESTNPGMVGRVKSGVSVIPNNQMNPAYSDGNADK